MKECKGKNESFVTKTGTMLSFNGTVIKIVLLLPAVMLTFTEH